MEPKEGARVFAVPEGLSPTEERLLAALRSRPGEVLSRGELLEMMHGTGGGNVQEHAVDAMVSRLRKALGPGGACIETVRRKGFRWNPDRVEVDPATGTVWVGGTRGRRGKEGRAPVPRRGRNRLVPAAQAGRRGPLHRDGPRPGIPVRAGRTGAGTEGGGRRAGGPRALLRRRPRGRVAPPLRSGRASPPAASELPLPPPPVQAFPWGVDQRALPGHGPECAIDGDTNTWYQSAGPARKKDGLVVEYHPSVRGTLSVRCGVPGSTNALPRIRVGVSSNDGSGIRKLGEVDPATGLFSGDIGEKPALRVFLIVAADSDEPFAVRSVTVEP